MTMRARTTSTPLTRADAAYILRRRNEGEPQIRIAAELDVNPGSVAEVLTGEQFPEARLLAADADPLN